MAELITALAGPMRDDAPAIGVSGFSMGAFAAYCAAATYPQIAAAVPIAGVPTFAERWRDVVLETSSYPFWEKAMLDTEAIQDTHCAFITALDPSPRMGRFAPKPLLILQGDQDLDSPKKYSVDLIRALQPYYIDQCDHLQFRIHDEAGHEINRSMIQETVDWFRRHLCE